MYKGIAGSDGIVIDCVYKLKQPELNIIKKDCVKDQEIDKFKIGLEKTTLDIENIKIKASNNLKEEDLAIFDAHLMMVNDPEFKDQVINMINEQSCNVEFAIKSVGDMMATMFESMDDAYFKERAADIKDITFRLCCNILEIEIPDLTILDKPYIIVAEDLSPSDIASVNKDYLLGFVTEVGGRTSHSAIVARSLEIPAVVGVKGIMDVINTDDLVALDGATGEVVVNPDHTVLESYKNKLKELNKEKDLLKVLKEEKSITLDGFQVELAGNIGNSKDIDAVINNGGEGVGLYRTEFLYMDKPNDFPSEDEQFEAYKVVLEQMGSKRVVIRTLDIGGDKTLPYFKFPAEMNPFLGYRAIRLCLDRQDIFITQLRALIRASVYGRLAIMFPMIATIEEFLSAKDLFNKTKESLINEGHKVSDNIELGLMIEIPAAAICADVFAKHADFLSIGTNDLIQYSMATDRMSEKVSYLYQPLNPSILKLIKLTIDGGHSAGKWVGMCGEMAGDYKAIPILIGLGLDEFSMSASSILKARDIIRKLSKKEMEILANKALLMESEVDVLKLLSMF